MEDLWKQTILFFLETSGPVFQFFLETSSPVFQFLPACLARNKTAVLSLTWILMPHSLQRIDGRIGWWDHTKQHSCGSLHRLCLYFKERPTVPWSDDYKLQGALATANTRSVLMRFPDATKKRLRLRAFSDEQGDNKSITGIWTRSTLEIDKAGPTDDQHACIWPYC